LIFTRGLAALILSLCFTYTLQAEFLNKNDVVQNDKFAEDIESIGNELKQKTGISLYLVMLRDLDDNMTTVDFEKSLVDELDEPFVVLTFVELQKKVDIFARPQSLYKDFDKKQILSPSATFIGAVVSAAMFARSWDDFKEIFGNYGGTILPVLAEKAKGDDIVKKYSVAMFNGYSDIADQIAASHGVKLSSSAGNGSQIFFDILRLVFYGIILYALIMIIRNKMQKRKGSDEQ
jgi:hypothetical protein